MAAHRHRRHDDAHLPVWHEAPASYLDPATGEFLPTWDEALDAIGDQDEPLHVARFGPRFDAQGVLAGSRDSARCIGYLTKYLTKHIADCHQAADRRAGTRTPSGSPTRSDTSRARRPAPTGCATASSPRTRRAGMRPGRCKGKAHRREYLGYAGRRVLVSRKWSGKTLADHRADRKAWLMATLGISATDPGPLHLGTRHPRRPRPHAPAQRLLHVVADRRRWHAALAEARAERPAQPARSFGNREGRMIAQSSRPTERLLTVAEAAELLSTSERFPRRLIAERRIRFVRVGRTHPHPRVRTGRVHRGRARRAGHHPEHTRKVSVIAMAKRRFGRVRQLASGRWQARYPGPDGVDRPAPETFATKTDAEIWLTLKEAEILNGDWINPDDGKVSLGEYAPTG